MLFDEEDEAGGREGGSALPCPEMVGGEGGCWLSPCRQLASRASRAVAANREKPRRQVSKGGRKGSGVCCGPEGTVYPALGCCSEAQTTLYRHAGKRLFSELFI